MTASVVVAAPTSFAETAAQSIADVIDAAIAARGSCSLALCGGTTPVPVYQILAAMPIRWASVAIFFGDERAVPPTDPDSNFRMARTALLDRIAVPPTQVHRMAAERQDAAAAAAVYDRLLPPQLDLLLLGVGPDGHTASLFPGASALAETRHRVVAVASPPSPLRPQVRRMTITPPVILAARRIVVMVAGADKAGVVARILEGPYQPVVLPAQLARLGTWVIDRAAGSELQRRGS